MDAAAADAAFSLDPVVVEEASLVVVDEVDELAGEDAGEGDFVDVFALVERLAAEGPLLFGRGMGRRDRRSSSSSSDDETNGGGPDLNVNMGSNAVSFTFLPPVCDASSSDDESLLSDCHTVRSSSDTASGGSWALADALSLAPLPRPLFLPLLITGDEDEEADEEEEEFAPNGDATGEDETTFALDDEVPEEPADPCVPRPAVLLRFSAPDRCECDEAKRLDGMRNPGAGVVEGGGR